MLAIRTAKNFFTEFLGVRTFVVGNGSSSGLPRRYIPRDLPLTIDGNETVGSTNQSFRVTQNKAYRPYGLLDGDRKERLAKIIRNARDLIDLRKSIEAGLKQGRYDFTLRDAAEVWAMIQAEAGAREVVKQSQQRIEHHNVSSTYSPKKTSYQQVIPSALEETTLVCNSYTQLTSILSQYPETVKGEAACYARAMTERFRTYITDEESGDLDVAAQSVRLTFLAFGHNDLTELPPALLSDLSKALREIWQECVQYVEKRPNNRIHT